MIFTHKGKVQTFWNLNQISDMLSEVSLPWIDQRAHPCLLRKHASLPFDIPVSSQSIQGAHCSCLPHKDAAHCPQLGRQEEYGTHLVISFSGIKCLCCPLFNAWKKLSHASCPDSFWKRKCSIWYFHHFQNRILPYSLNFYYLINILLLQRRKMIYLFFMHLITLHYKC